MKYRKAIIAVLALLAMSFFTAGSLGAQTPPAATPVITDETLDEDLGVEETQALLNTLSVRYSVDLSILTALVDEGYKVQQIWLALEAQRATGSTLKAALVKTEGLDGHGWGVLAQALGIKPGSAEFKDLKGKVDKDKKHKPDDLDMEGEEHSPGKPGREGGNGKGHDDDED